MTVNRFCGSSMSAVHYAAGQIQLGAGEVFIAGGVESMSRVPMMGFNPLPNPELAKKSAAYLGMGDTAENVANKYGISREAQEACRGQPAQGGRGDGGGAAGWRDRARAHQGRRGGQGRHPAPRHHG
jgi:hypothetical protein